MDVLQKISETPVDAAGLATERVEVKHVTIRDRPPEPFINDSVQQLANYRAVLDTSAGPITIELFPDRAPETVRQFLRLADAGVYDGVAGYRRRSREQLQPYVMTSPSSSIFGIAGRF